MKLGLEPGERVLKVHEARLDVGARTTPGVLCATTSRLIFVTSDGRALSMPAEQIAGTRRANTLGLLPTGLIVMSTEGREGREGREGQEKRFEVRRRDDWIALIERLRVGQVDDLPDAPEMSMPEMNGPIDPIVSWPAIMAWIAAPLALVPFLGVLPMIVLLVAGAMLLAKPRRRLDRTTGITATLLGVLALGAFGVEFFALLRHDGFDFPDGGSGLHLTTPLKIMQVVVLVFSIVLHECGHALAAYWSGDETSVQRRRLTLNPIPHIDLFGSIVLPGILIFSGSPAVFGWAKPVPINLANLRNRFWGNLAVSVAGVSANLLLAGIAMSALLALGVGLQLFAPDAMVRGVTDLLSGTHVTGVSLSIVWAMAADVLKMTIIVNLVLFAFNLLPIPPLDGSHVLETLLPRSLAALFAKLRPYGMILLVICIFTGVTRWIFGGVIAMTYLFLGIAGALCGVG